MAASRFEEVRRILKVGDHVKLRADNVHGQRSYNGRVASIGEDWITVSVPDGSPLLLHGLKTFNVTVRKETDTVLYLFETQATLQLGPRTLQLELRIEGDVQRVQRRWNARLSVLIDPEEALLVDGEAERPFKATILDLSVGGVLLHTCEPIPVGARLKLAFPLTGISKTIRAEAEVVRLMQLDSEGWHYLRLGAKFLNLGREQEDAIVKFAFQEQSKRRKWERW